MTLSNSAACSPVAALTRAQRPAPRTATLIAKSHTTAQRRGTNGRRCLAMELPSSRGNGQRPRKEAARPGTNMFFVVPKRDRSRTRTHTHRGLLRGRSFAARQMHGRGHREGDGPSPGWIGHAVERVHPLRQAVPVPGSGRRQDLLAHLLAQDLAEHRTWHVLDLHDPTRDLVGREQIAAVGPQRLLIELGARLELDRRDDYLSAPLERFTDHGGIGDGRVQAQDLLYLRG